MKAIISVLTASLFLSNTSVCHAAVIYWNSDGASSGSILGLDAGGVASAAFADPAANQSGTGGAGSQLISDGTTSVSSGYAGASGSYNFQARARSGALSTTTSTYFLITLTPAAGYALQLGSLTLGSRSTGSGPTVLSVYSGVDGYASAIGSASVLANSTWALSTIAFGGSALLGSVDSPVTLRVYGSGASGTASSPTWRIDDISLTVTPVPEPVTWALAAYFAVFGAVRLGRFCRRSRLTVR